MNPLREGLFLGLGVVLTLVLAFQMQPETTLGTSRFPGQVEDRPVPANSATVPVLDWSHNGQELMSLVRFGETEDLVTIHAIATGKELYRYDAALHTISTAALLPEHLRVVIGSYHGDLTHVGADSAEEAPIGRHPRHAVPTALAVSPYGRLLAGAFEDFSVTVWDLSTGRELASRVVFPNRKICELRFSSDGSRIVACSQAGKVAALGARRLRTLREVDIPGVSLRLAAFAGDRQIVTVAFDGTIRLYDVRQGRIVWTSPPSATSVPATDISPDGRYAVLGGFDSTITLWDLVARRAVPFQHGHSQPPLSVRFSPDGKTLASGSLDGTVRLWQVDSGVSHLLTDFSKAAAESE